MFERSHLATFRVCGNAFARCAIGERRRKLVCSDYSLASSSSSSLVIRIISAIRVLIDLSRSLYSRTLSAPVKSNPVAFLIVSIFRAIITSFIMFHFAFCPHTGRIFQIALCMPNKRKVRLSMVREARDRFSTCEKLLCKRRNLCALERSRRNAFKECFEACFSNPLDSQNFTRGGPTPAGRGKIVASPAQPWFPSHTFLKNMSSL